MLNSSSTRACEEIHELSRIFPFRRWPPVIPPMYFSPVILPVLSLLPHWVQMGRLNQDVPIYFSTRNYLKVCCLNVCEWSVEVRSSLTICHLIDDSRRLINVEVKSCHGNLRWRPVHSKKNSIRWKLTGKTDCFFRRKTDCFSRSCILPGFPDVFY